MITLVAKWERGWLDPRMEYSLWRQTAMAFGVNRMIFVPVTKRRGDLEEYPAVEDALAALPQTIHRVFLEPKKNQRHTDLPMLSLVDFKHPAKCVYVVGSSASGNVHLARAGDSVVWVPTPAQFDLWGYVAFGIVMYDRLLKGGAG